MKKRLSALFVAICLMVTCLPFSALVGAEETTPVTDSVVGYAVKAPADVDEAKSGYLGGKEHHWTSGQTLAVRHENGEHFFVLDEAIATKGGTSKDVTAEFHTNGMDVAGLPADVAITDDSAIAIRLKFNDNSKEITANPAAFRIYIAAPGGDVKESYSDLANTTAGAMWLDLKTGAYTNMLPCAVNSTAKNGYHFIGNMDGYMIIPLKTFGAGYTAEQLKTYFKAFRIKPVVSYANEAAEAPTDGSKYSSYKDRELLVGDVAFITNPADFVTVKTADIVKYGSGYDDTGYTAQVIPGYASTFADPNNKQSSIVANIANPTVAPDQTNNEQGYIHTYVLPGGMRAHKLAVNGNVLDDKIGSQYAYGYTNMYTYDGYNVDGTVANALKGVPVVDMGGSFNGTVGYAVRVVVTGNEGKTFNFKPFYSKVIGAAGYYSYLGTAEGLPFVDAKTGAESLLPTYEDATGTRTHGVVISGNIDGWILLPLLAKPYYNAGNAFEGDSMNKNLVGFGGYIYDMVDRDQTMYFGDVLWMKSHETFKAVRKSCEVLGNHDFQTVSATPATCDEPQKLNQECQRGCGATQVIDGDPALGHTWGTPTTVEADCVNGGYDLYKCTVCGGEKKENETLAKGHGYKEGLAEVKVDPGLHTPGSTVTLCADCGEIVKEASVIEPTCKETETKLINVKAATCKEDGYTGDKVCKACETVIEKGKVDPKLPHTEKTVNAKDATCKEAGYTGDVVCEVCEEEIKKGEATAKLPHTEKTVNAKEATCKEAGYTGDKVCEVCEEVLVKGEAVAKLDHTYGDWKETKAPTATEKGEKERECSACGDVEKAEIPATGTATGDGNNEGGNANKPSSPNTGDNNSILWVVLMAITAGAVLTVVAKKRCK